MFVATAAVAAVAAAATCYWLIRYNLFNFHFQYLESIRWLFYFFFHSVLDLFPRHCECNAIPMNTKKKNIMFISYMGNVFHTHTRYVSFRFFFAHTYHESIQFAAIRTHGICVTRKNGGAAAVREWLATIRRFILFGLMLFNINFTHTKLL